MKISHKRRNTKKINKLTKQAKYSTKYKRDLSRVIEEANSINIILTELSLERKANQILNDRSNIWKYLNYKDKVANLLTGRLTVSRPPRGVRVLLTINFNKDEIRKKRKKTGIPQPYSQPFSQSFSFFTGAYFRITPSSVRIFTASKILDFDNFFRTLTDRGDTPSGSIYSKYNLRSCLITYIYSK